MNGFFGGATTFLEPTLSWDEALGRFPDRYALILDPEYGGSDLIAGRIAAVSETEHGIRRAARALGPAPVRIRIERLF